MHRRALFFTVLLAGIALATACSDPASTGASGTDGGDGNTATDGGNGNRDAGGGGTSDGGGGGSAAACKRGIAYNDHSLADLTALSKSVRWWYNWYYQPEDAVKSAFGSLDVEYVPMMWGTKFDLAELESSLLPSETTLLGYNEPNFFAQANLSAADAAQEWPKLQAVADAHGLQLASPALNFCGGGCYDEDPFNYMDDFFAACTDCRVDVLAIHIYVGCAGDGKNHAQWMINHLKTWESRFPSLPIWLTEFACNDATSDADQLAFLKDAVTYLESDPRVERYAWFSGRADNVPHVDLLGSDGQLTSLGQAYVEAPQDPACNR